MYLCRVTIGKKQNQAYLRTKVANTEALTYEEFIVLLLGSDLVRDSVCEISGPHPGSSLSPGLRDGLYEPLPSHG